MSRDTLLVIDDSPLDLTIFREIFKHLFHVECFEESRPAIAYIHRNSDRICAVLLDICLGRRGAGFQVLQQLQAAEETSSLPVILITSDAREEYVLNGLNKGAVDFLVKPVDPLTVQERICGCVRRAWQPGSTILDGPEPAADTEQPAAPVDTLTEAEYWDRLLELFFQARPNLSPAKYHALGRISAALAEGLCKAVPTCGLTLEEAQLIGRAAAYCDVGLLGIPDNIIEMGQDQGGSGQEVYFRHTALGHALFTTGPSSSRPLARYAAEIAYWHHKNFDGTGPPRRAPLPSPSAPRSCVPPSAAWGIWTISGATPTVWIGRFALWQPMWAALSLPISIRLPGSRWTISRPISVPFKPLTSIHITKSAQFGLVPNWAFPSMRDSSIGFQAKNTLVFLKKVMYNKGNIRSKYTLIAEAGSTAGRFGCPRVCKGGGL